MIENVERIDKKKGAECLKNVDLEKGVKPAAALFCFLSKLDFASAQSSLREGC